MTAGIALLVIAEVCRLSIRRIPELLSMLSLAYGVFALGAENGATFSYCTSCLRFGVFGRPGQRRASVPGQSQAEKACEPGNTAYDVFALGTGTGVTFSYCACCFHIGLFGRPGQRRASVPGQSQAVKSC